VAVVPYSHISQLANRTRRRMFGFYRTTKFRVIWDKCS
jgi:hypothetical protein